MKGSNTYFKFMPFAPHARLSLFMLLKHKSIFLANKDVLNDPTDCSPYIYVDLDDEDVKSRIREISKDDKVEDNYWKRQAMELVELIDININPEIETKSDSGARRRRRIYFDDRMYESYESGVGENFVKRHTNSLVDDAKIFSLSRVWNEPRLWAHYAASHSGLCFELTGIDTLPDAIFSGRVDYTSRRPRVAASDVVIVRKKGSSQHKDEILSRLYLQKSLGWEYEKEHRLILAKADFDRVKPTLRLPEGDYIKFDKLKLERIILGINASYQNYEMIKQFINDFTEGKNRPEICRVKQNADDYEITMEDAYSYYEDIPF